MAPEELHRVVREKLVAAGQRYTGNRRALVDVLGAEGGPLTLPELLSRDPALSQSSAYRNLAVLEEAGVVRRVVIGAEHARFELAEALTVHHHHLVCSACGVVVDFELGPEVERLLDRALAAAAADRRFTPEQHSLDLVGLCAACR